MEDAIILGIIFGFSTLICVMGYRLAKLKLSQDKGIEEEAFDRLARAFVQHKKEMTERVKKLETSMTEEKQKIKNTPPQIEEPRKNSNLTNDLESKNKVRS